MRRWEGTLAEISDGAIGAPRLSLTGCVREADKILIASRAQLLLLVLALFAAAVNGLRVEHALGRRSAILSAATALTALRPAPARAGGTGKDDKAFQSCISQCVYTETKISKGIAKVEVMSRTEAYAKCKPQCATSKDQVRDRDSAT